MEQVVDSIFHMLHRSHLHKPCLQKQGDLANVEFFILLGISVMLENQESGVTLSEVIEVTGMTMSAASKKISILEKKGFIKRNVSQEDKRKVCITLTEKGLEICEKERTEKQAWLSEVISRMGIDNARQMVELMGMMFDIIENMEQERDHE